MLLCHGWLSCKIPFADSVTECVQVFLSASVADPDPGSVAFLTPGSGIRNRFFPDLGSRIPNPYFWELRDNFWGKKFYNSLKIGPNFFLQHFKNKMFKSCEIYDSKKKVRQQIFFYRCLSSLFLDPRSGIRDKNQDPGSGIKIRIRDKNQDPGSGINIPDPPHCFLHSTTFETKKFRLACLWINGTS